MNRTSKIFAVLSCFCMAGVGATGYAGILNDHPDAYDNNLGPGTGGRWAGSSPFSDGFDLNGYVDFAVFTAADFNSNFSGLGYIPSGPLVYTYQVFNTGPDVISAEIVGVVNSANNIGQFDIGDLAAFDMDLSSGIAQWDFASLGPGESSWGLAYSSPNIPELGFSITVDGGSTAEAMVPIPSSTAIPEPASFVLLVTGGLLTFFRRNRAQLSLVKLQGVGQNRCERSPRR